MATQAKVDAGHFFAGFASDCSFEDIPPRILSHVKMLFLDTIAVILCGSSAPGIAALTRVIADMGGRKDASILGSAYKVPAPHAVLVNASKCHARDFDDSHSIAPLHACGTVVSAALAAAEYAGGVSGRDLLAALVVGIESNCRLALAFGMEKDTTGEFPEYRGWHPTSIGGAFASGLTFGKLLGFSREKLFDTLGVTLSQASGTLQVILDGGLMKRVQPGLASRSGVFSALLVKAGLDGAAHPFEGPYGLMPMYYSGKYDRSWLTEGWGENYGLEDLAAKFYPCCRLTHSSIDACLDLMQEEGITAENVRRVTVRVAKPTLDIVGRPFEIRRNPQVDAQFSIQYTVANALLKGHVIIEDFSDDNVRNPEISKLIPLVEVFHAPEFDKARWTCEVEVFLRDGQTVRRRVDAIRGMKANPAPISALYTKVEDCIANSPLRGSALNADRLISYVESLEEVPDVRRLIELATKREEGAS